MIEKVVLALVNSKRDRHDVPLLKDLNNLTPEALKEYREDAIAAIEAMREPSEGMLKSVQHEAMLFNNDVDMERTYTKMIDAALKEE